MYRHVFLKCLNGIKIKYKCYANNAKVIKFQKKGPSEFNKLNTNYKLACN